MKFVDLNLDDAGLVPSQWIWFDACASSTADERPSLLRAHTATRWCMTDPEAYDNIYEGNCRTFAEGAHLRSSDAGRVVALLGNLPALLDKAFAIKGGVPRF
jgi:hypothetical protein